jgi:hypothetical protein
MMVEFKPSDTLGPGLFCIDVLNAGVRVGHIRRQLATGAFRYYRGANYELTLAFEDADLERLKRRVSETP